MKKKTEKIRFLAAVLLIVLLTACRSQASQNPEAEAQSAGTMEGTEAADGADAVDEAAAVKKAYTADTPISDPVFGDYGRLIFPVDEGYYSGDTLGKLDLT